MARVDAQHQRFTPARGEDSARLAQTSDPFRFTLVRGRAELDLGAGSESPRVAPDKGSIRYSPALDLVELWFTPARGENRNPAMSWWRFIAVHPRARGGTKTVLVRALAECGSPPRAGMHF